MTITNEKVERYCIEHSTNISSQVRDIANYTYENHPQARMISGDLVASIFTFLIKAKNVKKILEVGTFTGYSALAMAEALPSDGEVLTLDRDQSTTDLAKSFWEKSKSGHKIKTIFGDAKEVIKNLDQTFDLIFIDADKKGYLTYLQEGLKKLNPGGIIIADNVLWRGEVADSPVAGENNAAGAMREFNEYVASREDLNKVLLPVRDGLYLIQKA